MKIHAFDIYEFGILAKQSQQSLPDGLIIFLGQNEAGKSTTLEFFRTVLTGFPSSRSKKSREGLFSQKSPSMGGMISLETNAMGAMRLERTRQNFNLFDEKGAALNTNLYDSLLAGTNRDIYSALYGFSLSELQSIDSIEEDDVRSVLYGTSFGLGLFSPQKALTHIENILSAKGAKSLAKNESLRTLFKENALRIEQINTELADIIEKNSLIDEYYKTYEANAQELHRIKEEKEKKYQSLTYQKRKLDAWQLYEEYYLIEQKISRIPKFSDDFPRNASELIQIFKGQELQFQKELEALDERKSFLLDSLNKKEYNAQLVNYLPRIKQLIEYKASYRNASIKLPYTVDALSRAQKELTQCIDYLGDDWTDEKIKEIHFSLEVHKNIDEFENKFHKAETEKNQLEQSIEHLNQEKQIIADDISHIEHTLSALPPTKQEISLSLRDDLQTALRRTQDAQEKLPEKRKYLNRAQSEYARAVQQLSFTITPSFETLSTILDAQEQSMQLAQGIADQSKKASDTKQLYIQTKKYVDRLEEQHAYLTSENRKHLHLQRSFLHKKRSMLSRAKTLYYSQIDDNERIAELQEQYNEILEQLPIKTSNIVVLLLGFLALSLGGSLLALALVYDMHVIDISFVSQNAFLLEHLPSIVDFPKTYANHSPFAFLIFLIGFTSIYINIPMYSPDRKKKLFMLEQIDRRKQIIESKVNKNQAEFAKLCEQLQLGEFTNAHIDTLEAELEDEQEQIIQKEKLIKETSSTALELTNVKKQLTKELAEYHEEERKTQTLRKLWQEHFMSLAVTDIPSPEGVEAYFMRLEKIRLTKQTVTQLEEEIASFENAEEKLVDLLKSSTQFAYENSMLNTDVVKKAQNILAACLEGDKINERRKQFLENIENLKAKQNAIVATIEEKSKQYSTHTKLIEEIEHSWQNYLTNIGLDTTFSVQTTKNIINHIEKCHATQAKLETLAKEYDLHKQELDKLQNALGHILEVLDITPLLRLDKQPDYLATLDSIYTEAEKAKEMLNAKIGLEEQCDHLDKEIAKLQESKAVINRDFTLLMDSLGVENIDVFSEYATLLDTLHSLNRDKQVLEDKLNFVALGRSLEDFLSEFKNVDYSILEHQKNVQEKEYDELIILQDDLTNALAEQSAFIKQIENSNLLTELKQEKSILLEQSNEALENYMKYALARSFIQKAKQKYEEEKQPELIKTASEIFSHITEEKWINITSSIEDNVLTINPKRGTPITPDKLSQGTREQLYLAIRLAYMKNAVQYKEPLPLIMDDILVNFDVTRSVQTAKTLSTFIDSEPSHQILFFTCHPHIVTVLQENVAKSSLYLINDGKISASS